MEDKIEVGEYVRTKEGYIGILIEHIPNALNYLKIDVGKEIRRDNGMSDNYIYTRYGFQLKHSKQLIDLIEEGDYVNGYRVINVINEGPCPCGECVDIDSSKDSSECTLWEEDIKTILTKEQFEANCYKVGGKNE